MEFILSKVVWVFATPGDMLVLLLVVGGFLALSHHKSRQDFGRGLCFAVAVLFFIIAIFPVDELLLTPLENDFTWSRIDHVDGIILLGGDENPRYSDERGEPVVGYSSSRYLTFAALARHYPAAKLVYSGGSGELSPYGPMREADVARNALASLGVPVDHMLFENRSRNTHENAVMTAAMVHPTPGETWLLVTSAWHMPRAMGCFRKAGFHVMAAPAGYMTGGKYRDPLKFNLAEHLTRLTLAVHEYYGLIAYSLLGYTDSQWPQ